MKYGTKEYYAEKERLENALENLTSSSRTHYKALGREILNQAYIKNIRGVETHYQEDSDGNPCVMVKMWKRSWMVEMIEGTGDKYKLIEIWPRTNKPHNLSSGTLEEVMNHLALVKHPHEA